MKRLISAISVLLMPCVALAEVESNSVFLKHCDNMPRLADAVMVLRQDDLSFDETLGKMAGRLVAAGIYQGDDYSMLFGIIIAAYNRPLFNSAESKQLFSDFAHDVTEACILTVMGDTEAFKTLMGEVTPELRKTP